MWESLMEWLGSLTKYGLDKVIPAMILLVMGILIVRILMRILKNAFQRTHLEKAAVSLITSAVRILLYLLLMLIVASSLGIDVTGIVALASVLSLAISLSVQNALTNVIGGFTLLATRPFVSEDFVEIAGQAGIVKEIGLTYTKLQTADGKMISIPNNSVISAQIVNYTATGIRRVDVNVAVSYQCRTEDVLQVLKLAAQVPTAMADREPYTAVTRYGEHAIEYVLQVWCAADDYWTTLHAVNQKIQSVLADNGIQMTYPHLNVHLEQ